MHTVDLSDESGFSLVEILVAAFVLVAGALVAFSLIDGANKSISLNSARIGATNLGRELVEYGRATDYDSLQPSLLVAALQTRAGGTGTPWTVERRGVRYTVEASVCTFDDAKDGLAAAPPANACPAAAPIAGVTTVEQNPDDFRRVTFVMTWKVRGRTASATQSALIVNPAGGLGPRVTGLEPASSEVTSDSATSWSPTLLTTDSAVAVRWIVDDGVSQGDATGGPTSWGLSWPLGAPRTDPLDVDGTWVVDGTYSLQAQATSSRGIPGEARVATVRVNRHAPAVVPGLAGGFNARHGIVDMHWRRDPESDLIGYRVERSDGAVVCGPTTDGREWASTSCIDHSPPSSNSVKYTLYAIDCAPQSLTSCTPRKGVASTLPVKLAAADAPAAPELITAARTPEGLPQLDWPDPPAGSYVAFYLIYRVQGTVTGAP